MGSERDLIYQRLSAHEPIHDYISVTGCFRTYQGPVFTTSNNISYPSRHSFRFRGNKLIEENVTTMISGISDSSTYNNILVEVLKKQLAILTGKYGEPTRKFDDIFTWSAFERYYKFAAIWEFGHSQIRVYVVVTDGKDFQIDINRIPTEEAKNNILAKEVERQRTLFFSLKKGGSREHVENLLLKLKPEYAKLEKGDGYIRVHGVFTGGLQEDLVTYYFDTNNELTYYKVRAYFDNSAQTRREYYQLVLPKMDEFKVRLIEIFGQPHFEEKPPEFSDITELNTFAYWQIKSDLRVYLFVEKNGEYVVPKYQVEFYKREDSTSK